MWQKFRKREEAIKVYYKDKGEPARDHLSRTAVDGVISWEPVSMHWNIILSLHLETMPWPQVCQRKERSCQDVIIPPHPTPPHLETMPCWVWPQVCQRKERSCQDVIIPPHPTPRHPTPPASGDDAMLTVAAIVTRMLVSESCGWWLVNGLFWLRNPLVLVAESPFFGCGIVFFGCGIGYFWLRNRFFFGCGSAFFGCGSVSGFGCGIAEIWLRKRRNMVSESDFIHWRWLRLAGPKLSCQILDALQEEQKTG